MIEKLIPPTLDEIEQALTNFNSAVDKEDVLGGTIYAAVCTAVLERLAACLRSGAYAIVSAIPVTCSTCQHARGDSERDGSLTCCDPSEANPLHWQDVPDTFSCIHHRPQLGD